MLAISPVRLNTTCVKSNAVRQQRPHDKPEMMLDLRSYLRSTQGRPEVVRSYFRHRSTEYAQD
jgi:hypothetical protein